MPAVIALALAALLAAPDGRFSEGLSLFRQAAEARSPEGFRRAAAAWEALAAEGAADAKLYVNIGNARAFAGDAGEAVLAYRRALVLDPGEPRAAAGLAAVRRTLGLPEPEAGAGKGLLRTLFFWHDSLSMAARRALLAALWLAGWLLLATRLLQGWKNCSEQIFHPWKNSSGSVFTGVCLVAAGALLVSLAVSDAEARGREEAVLTTRTEGRTGDGDFYSPSHSAPLPAGAEAEILERRAAWSHVRLRDGSTAWLPAARLAPVLPSAGD
jgi:tetratricopeptide (TPR) repeat protein